MHFRYTMSSLLLLPLVAATSCRRSGLALGTYELNDNKSTYVHVPPIHMKIRASFLSDGTFDLQPFDLHGTWEESGGFVNLKIMHPAWIFNSLEGRPLKADEPLVVSWKMVKNDELAWEPKAFKENHALVLVFTRQN